MDSESLKQALLMVEKFADKELAPKALEWDQYPSRDFPKELLDQARGIGLFSFLLPENQGGIGGTPEQLALLLEAISQREAGFAGLVFSHNLAAYFFSMAQKQFPSDKLLSFPCYLEPEYLEESALKSEPAGNGKIRVSGKLRNVIGAGIADWLFAPVSEPEGISWFCLEPVRAGLRREKLPLTLGMRTASPCDLVFERVELSEAERVGQAGAGKDLCRSAYRKFYPAASAILIGLIAGSARAAIKYGQDRYQGGNMIAQHEQIRFYYGSMLAGYFSFKAGLEKIAEDSADDASRIALKVMAGDLAVRATMDGVQLLGGYGYMHDYGQEKRMRDAGSAEKFLGSAKNLTLSLADGFIKNIS